MTRRTLRPTAVLAATALALTLAACGGADDSVPASPSDAASSATTEPTETATTGTDGEVDAEAGGVALGDVSAHVTLPTGFSVPAEEDDLTGTQSPGPEGVTSTVVLHAVAGDPAAQTPDAPVLLVTKAEPAQDPGQVMAGVAAAGQMGAEGVEVTAGAPTPVEVGGEQGQRVHVEMTAPAQAGTSSAAEIVVVNHGDATYLGLVRGPLDQDTTAAQLDELLANWTWAN